MKDRRLLYLDAHQLSACLWRPGGMTSEGAFAADADGIRQFTAYAARHPNSVFVILVNVPEEAYHTESIPFLRGADRRIVLERKLGQLFFNKALTASLSLGYEKSTRKDERILFAALNDASFFSPWVSAIKAGGAMLAGIYSLPLLAPFLLRKLSIALPRCLLLTVQDESIRQSFLEAGELHFSRLAPLPDASVEGIGRAFSSEAHKLRQYLASQRVIGRKEPIVAFILAHAEALSAVRANCLDSETIEYRIISIEECARRVGMKTAPSSCHCEALFLHLLMSSPPRMQFANDDQRSGYRVARIESALVATGALALTCCLLFSANLAFDTHSLRRASVAIANEAAQSRQRYHDVVQTFPALSTSTESLRLVAERYHRLDLLTPDRLLREFADALSAVPEVELNALDWTAGRPASISSSPTSASNADSGEALLVRGTLKLPPQADTRQTLGVFDRLLGALAANPALRVEIVERPFALESGQLLKGGGGDGEPDRPRAFALQIARRAS